MESVKIIEAGLLLRSWHGGDAEAIHLACQDVLIQRWTLVPSPYRLQDARTFVDEFAPKTLAAGSGAHLGVFDPDTGELLGSCGFVALDPAAGTGEIGYWTAPWARGRGVAVRACRALARWGFQTLGLRRITWLAAVGNHASRLVALRAGIRVDGVVRGGMRTRDGDWADAWVGSLLPDDLPALADDAPAAAPAGSPEAVRAATFGRPQPILTAGTPGGPIVLRAPTETDIEAIIASCQDPDSLRWTTLPPAYGRSDAEFFIERLARQRWHRGEAAVFAITGPDDAYAGTIELRIDPADPAVADVGYLVAPWARGRGYAPAALRALSAWGFESLALERVEWYAYLGNDASRRVAEKAGFTFEGVTRSGVARHGVRLDAWRAAMLPRDLDDTARSGA